MEPIIVKRDGLDHIKSEYHYAQSMRENMFGNKIFSQFKFDKKFSDNFDSKGNVLESKMVSLFTDKEVVDYYKDLATNKLVTQESKLRAEMFLFISENINNFNLNMWKPVKNVKIDEDYLLSIVNDENKVVDEIIDYLTFGNEFNVERKIGNFFSEKKPTPESYSTLKDALTAFVKKGDTLKNEDAILKDIVNEEDVLILESNEESGETNNDTVTVEAQVVESDKNEKKTDFTKNVESCLKEIICCFPKKSPMYILFNKMCKVNQIDGVTGLMIQLKDDTSKKSIFEITFKNDILDTLIKFQPMIVSILPKIAGNIEKSVLKFSEEIDAPLDSELNYQGILNRFIKVVTEQKGEGEKRIVGSLIKMFLSESMNGGNDDDVVETKDDDHDDNDSDNNFDMNDVDEKMGVNKNRNGNNKK